jgi:hypothetical protein
MQQFICIMMIASAILLIGVMKDDENFIDGGNNLPFDSYHANVH